MSGYNLTYIELSDDERNYVDLKGPLLLGKSINEKLFRHVESLDGSIKLLWLNNRIIGHHGYGPMFCYNCKKLYPKSDAHCECDSRFFHWPNTKEEADHLLFLKSLREQFTEMKK